MPKTVWILGAGFSRSLGGPLLADFFTDEQLALTTHHFEGVTELRDSNVRDLHELFWGGPPRRRGVRPERPWADAEEFLTLLDSAARNQNGNEAKVLARVDGRYIDEGGAVERVRRAALAYVTIVTDYFVPRKRDEAEELERWQPYLAWGRTLARSSDTVITFNYDRVVELCAGDALTVLDPTNPKATPPTSGPSLLKLHGSVNWWEFYDHQIMGPRIAWQRGMIGRETLLIQEALPFIALPGPTKYHSASRLAHLWGAAEGALREADRVVLIGFRFPPGDASARHRLLHAIRQNRRDGLRVHLVLGSDTGHHDVRRVAALLEATVRARTVEGRMVGEVRAEPLFAEDFIDTQGLE